MRTEASAKNPLRGASGPCRAHRLSRDDRRGQTSAAPERAPAAAPRRGLRVSARRPRRSGPARRRSRRRFRRSRSSGSGQPAASSDPLMPTSLVAIGETLRARLDGPWNQPADGTEPEDRRGVKECGLSRRGADWRAVEPAEAGVLAGLGVALDPAVRLDRRLGARVQGLAAGTERLRDLLAHDLAHGIALVAQLGGSAGAITAPANVL